MEMLLVSERRVARRAVIVIALRAGEEPHGDERAARLVLRGRSGVSEAVESLVRRSVRDDNTRRESTHCRFP
ncbi:hypothetical protein [Sorangium sp. So ce131]|uniref:hypothetical protein n=1 Tax=Sorangium sp. So ce131 TaxID=3133282 RepID=UPI003F5FE041